MRSAWISGAVLAAGLVGLLGCSSSSSGGGGSGSSSGGSGAVTFSCNVATANLCTQLLVPQSEVSGEASSCTGSEQGTPGTGCPTAGLVGCCKSTNNPSNEEQCYYSAMEASAGMSTCNSTHGTWSTTM